MQHKKHPIAGALAALTDLPATDFAELPEVAVCSEGEARICPFGSLEECSEERVTVRAGDREAEIRGAGLRVTSVGPEGITVRGRVEEIRFRGREEQR